jgi:hypothetical protein
MLRLADDLDQQCGPGLSLPEVRAQAQAMRPRYYVPCARCGRPIVPWSSYKHLASSYVIRDGKRLCEPCAAKACIRYVLRQREKAVL